MGFNQLMLNPYMQKNGSNNEMNKSMGSGFGALFTNPMIMAKLKAMFNQNNGMIKNNNLPGKDYSSHYGPSGLLGEDM